MPESPNPNDDLARRFGKNLNRARRRAGYSQEELGLMATLHRTEIGLLEHGRCLPRLDTFVKLLGSLEGEAADLLDYYETKVKLDAEQIARLTQRLAERLKETVGHREQEAARAELELAGLRGQRQQLVDSHLANPKAVPLDVLEVKQAELEEKDQPRRG